VAIRFSGDTKKPPLSGQPGAGRDKSRGRPKVRRAGQCGGEKLFSEKPASGRKTEEFFPADAVKTNAAKNCQTQEVEYLGKRGNNLTSPDTSPEHISGFQNMLRLLTQVFFYKRLKKYTPLVSNQ